MAEFLRTSGISHHIEEIIINAKEKLVIVSPYLKLTENLFERLKETDSKGVNIVFIYGKSELNPSEKRKLNELKNLSLFYYKNLHAKCYYNESKMLITSMNLYEFSEKNNREMGVLIDKLNDSSIYESAEQETTSIKEAAKLEKVTVLQSQEVRHKGVRSFEFQKKGDITSWKEKLLDLLSERYTSLEFKIDGRESTVVCKSFLTENLSLEVLPNKGLMRIVFRFEGKDKKELFHKVYATGKKSVEDLYPKGVVGWGNLMMRVKLDFSHDKFPNIFKYDDSSIEQTVNHIANGGDLINRILNNKL